MAKDQGYGIHWFRRDLRLVGNAALATQLGRWGGRVVGVFFLDQRFLSRPDFSAVRFAFFLETLRALKAELREAGGDLLVLEASPDEGFRKLAAKLKAAGSALPAAVSFNRDYEPFARERDARLTEVLEQELGIEVTHDRDHLVIEPRELAKPTGGGYYQVFSPFARRWRELLKTDDELKGRLAQATRKPPCRFALTWKALLKTRASELSDQLDAFIAKNAPLVKIALPKAGSAAARDQALRFKRAALDEYADRRDLPAIEGTSRLSVYLKNGSVTTAQLISWLGLTDAKKSDTGHQKFFDELIWREFYYHILFHEPRVEHEAFNPKYKKLAWSGRDEWLEAWQEGRTGYPIIDAGMRELRETGWMHNRVRMIVASFLTKDLLIDWREGERWFMRNLLDGDLAPNNGGWQWAASTGCDPQPYFRVFNPTLQARKFDLDGTYIKRFVPELKKLSSRELHSATLKARPPGYPAPVVDHDRQRLAALRLFKTPAAVS